MLMVFLSEESYSQYKVKIIVVDSVYAFPIELASVKLASNSRFTDVNGEASFEVNESKNIVVATYLGYVNYVKNIKVETDTVLTVLLKPTIQVLNEVKINGKRAILERRPDRTIYRVGVNDKNDRVTDLLQKIPFVTISNNTLRIKGKINNQILKNGRESNLSLQDLIATNAARIDSIEVITAPSARYDGEYQNVVNIVFKKNDDFIGGTFGARLGTRDKSLSASFSKTDSKSSENFGLYLSTDKSRIGSTSKTNFFDPVPYGLYQEQMAISRTPALNTSFDMEYNLKKNQNISFGAKVDVAKVISLEEYTSLIMPANVFQKNNNEINTKRTNVNFNAAYVKKISETSRFYFTNMLNFNNDRRFFNAISNQNPFINDNRTKINEFTSRIDYEFLMAANAQAETGVKTLLRQYVFLPKYNGIDKQKMVFNQSIFATYFSMTRTVKKIMLRVGIRGELTQNKYSNDENLILNLLPNILFNYNINDKNSLSLSYRRTLGRPSFLMLNTFEDKETPFKNKKGNPNLANQLSNIIELEENMSSGKTSLSFAVSYEKGSKLINTQLLNGGNATTEITYGNFSESNRFKLFYSLSMPIVPEQISLFSSGSISLFQIKGLGYKNKGCLKTVNAGFSYEPISNLAIEFFFNYLENAFALQSAYGNSVFTDLNAGYNLKQSSFGIQFTNPIMDKIREYNNGNATGIAFTGNSYYRGRSIAISYSYRFGKTKYHEKQTKEIRNTDVTKGQKL